MNTKDTFIVIPDWMLDHPLDIWETVVLSVIWGFSQDGETAFHGSRTYLARKAKCSIDKIDKCTKRLVALGLVEKREKYINGIKFCEYSAVTGGSRCERPVAATSGEVAAVPGGGSRRERHNNIDDNADNKLSANSDKKASPAFDFKKAVIGMGVSEQHAADWMVVRKAKRMTNTRTAFERLKNQIEKACQRYGLTPDDCVAYAASKDWGGFDAGWDDVRNIKPINADGTSQDDRLRARLNAEYAKFSEPKHFGVSASDKR